MMFQRALFTFVALGVAWVSGFTSKKTMSPITADIVTKITADVAKGSTQFPVESTSGFEIGNIVQIESNGRKELGQISGLGSILVKCPSEYAHTTGGTITVLPMITFYEECEATTAPTMSPSTAPSASPTEAPTEAPTASPTEEPCEKCCWACGTDAGKADKCWDGGWCEFCECCEDGTTESNLWGGCGKCNNEDCADKVCDNGECCEFCDDYECCGG